MIGGQWILAWAAVILVAAIAWMVVGFLNRDPEEAPKLHRPTSPVRRLVYRVVVLLGAAVLVVNVAGRWWPLLFGAAAPGADDRWCRVWPVLSPAPFEWPLIAVFLLALMSLWPRCSRPVELSPEGTAYAWICIGLVFLWFGLVEPFDSPGLDILLSSLVTGGVFLVLGILHVVAWSRHRRQLAHEHPES